MVFIKYPKIKILGDLSNDGLLTIPGKVMVSEKYDGAQAGFYIENNIIYFTSHNQDLTNSVQIEKTGIPKKWNFIEPILNIWKETPEIFNTNYYVYCESTQKHTLKYNDDIPGLIGYDILNIQTNEFLPWQETEAEFERIGSPFIHIYAERESTEITVDWLKSLYQKSAYRDGTAEGVVIKRYDIKSKYGKPLFAKIVDDKFKETHKEVWGESPPKQNNEFKIAEIYATPARIEKIIYKIRDDGNEISMPLMKILFREVIKDFLEEEIVEIYENYKCIDFKALEKLVSKKCVKVLKDVMVNDS